MSELELGVRGGETVYGIYLGGLSDPSELCSKERADGKKTVVEVCVVFDDGSVYEMTYKEFKSRITGGQL